MDAILSCQTTLTTQIETVQLDLSIVKHDLQKIYSRISNVEQRISDIEDVVNPLSVESRSQQAVLQEHSANLGDLEDRLRRNNLYFIDFLEGVQGKDLELFLKKWLKSVIGY